MRLRSTSLHGELMSVPASVEELLQLIRKSGMIDEDKLGCFLQMCEDAGGRPTDLQEFTDLLVAEGVLTSFQAEQYLLGKWRGFTIGKYKLLERIGVGGMGQVFLCEHMLMQRRVAVKVLPPAKAEQPAALGRFYREARAAGSLQHPHVIRTHDIDQEANLHYIVMDYVDGSNLMDIVKKFGPMNIDRAVSYIRQAALGLDYAFRSGLIHRDIKPGNILIDRKGVARILDMGLARFYKDHSDQLTMKYDDKIVLGTADYVAPEQVANSHSVDIRADIYGLGATLYFLLAGHPPFPVGTVSQKLLWHRMKDPTPIQQLRPEVPDGLAALVTRMLSKDPKARPQTPAQVAAELETWLAPNTPLPSEEEMPQLSPAAKEGAAVIDEMPAPEPELVGAGAPKAGSGPVRPAETRSGPFSAPAARVAPFAAPSPWDAPDRQVQVETVEAAAHQTPTAANAPPRPASNPFLRDDRNEPERRPPWGVIAAVAGGALVTAGIFAALKFLG